MEADNLRIRSFFEVFWVPFLKMAPRRLREHPQTSKIMKIYQNFRPKPHFFQIKKASISSCFLNIFGDNIGGTGPKTKNASISSCFLNIFSEKIGGIVPKTVSIPSCFLNIFGKKIGCTVQIFACLLDKGCEILCSRIRRKLNLVLLCLWQE